MEYARTLLPERKKKLARGGSGKVEHPACSNLVAAVGTYRIPFALMMIRTILALCILQNTFAYILFTWPSFNIEESTSKQHKNKNKLPSFLIKKRMHASSASIPFFTDEPLVTTLSKKLLRFILRLVSGNQRVEPLSNSGNSGTKLSASSMATSTVSSARNIRAPTATTYPPIRVARKYSYSDAELLENKEEEVTMPTSTTSVLPVPPTSHTSPTVSGHTRSLAIDRENTLRILSDIKALRRTSVRPLSAAAV